MEAADPPWDKLKRRCSRKIYKVYLADISGFATKEYAVI